jgi:sulfite reductase (NADPH) hemoprotein beta-component
LPAAASARAALARAARDNPAFARWYRSNVMPHHTQGYANVSLSLKSAGRPPGDACGVGNGGDGVTG